MNEPIVRVEKEFDHLEKLSPDYTERLLSLMTTKLALVQSLYALSASQQAVQPGEDVTPLMGVIARRESLVDQLAHVQLQLQPFQSDDPEQRIWASPERRSTCRDVVSKIEKLMTEVLRLDGLTLDTMCQQRDLIAAELRHGLDSNLTQRAYASSDSLQPSVLDINDL